MNRNLICFLLAFFSFNAEVFSATILPLQVGNVWYYSLSVTTIETDNYTKQPELITGTTVINDTLYYEFGTPEKFTYYLREDSAGNIMVRSPGLAEQPYYRIDAEVGESWECKILSSLNNPYTYRITFESNTDTVVTEAGTFTGCYRYSVENISVTDSFHREWLAPNIGKVKWYSNVMARQEQALIKARIYGETIPPYPLPIPILRTLPENGKQNVSVDMDSIIAYLSLYIRPESITSNVISAVSQTRGPLSGFTKCTPSSKMVFIFHFDKPLLYNETVDVTISAGFTDYIGDILMEPYTFSFTTEPAPTFIESNPTDFVISTYPNPFNASTTLYYSLPNPDHVTLSVYSLTGQKVATLVDDTMNAGTHSAIFDGNGLSSGIYFYRFETPGFENTGKMLLVK